MLRDFVHLEGDVPGLQGIDTGGQLAEEVVDGRRPGGAGPEMAHRIDERPPALHGAVREPVWLQQTNQIIGRGSNVARGLPPGRACRPDVILVTPGAGRRQNLIVATVLADQNIQPLTQFLFLPAKGSLLVGLQELASDCLVPLALTKHPGQHLLSYVAGSPVLTQQLKVRRDAQFHGKGFGHAHGEAVQRADMQPVQTLQQLPQDLQEFALPSVGLPDQLSGPQRCLRRRRRLTEISDHRIENLPGCLSREGKGDDAVRLDPPGHQLDIAVGQLEGLA